MNNKAVCRTAPATPGLSIRVMAYDDGIFPLRLLPFPSSPLSSFLTLSCFPPISYSPYSWEKKFMWVLTKSMYFIKISFRTKLKKDQFHPNVLFFFLSTGFALYSIDSND